MTLILGVNAIIRISMRIAWMKEFQLVKYLLIHFAEY